MHLASVTLLIIFTKEINSAKDEAKKIKYNNDFDEHTLVQDATVFPYTAAILKKSSYVSAGALIDENWIFTAADSLYLIRESIRIIRVRLGSLNYRQEGTLLPIKYYEIHPYYERNKPSFDLALIKLAEPVSFTSSISPIKLLKTNKGSIPSHFAVTAWSPFPEYSESNHVTSMELINRRRSLTLTHLHPSDPEDCLEEMETIGITRTNAVMCLDNGVVADPCRRDIGAPVVYNGVLWGIISSWTPENCENELAGPSFVTMINTPNVSSWVHSVTNQLKWEPGRDFETTVKPLKTTDRVAVEYSDESGLIRHNAAVARWRNKRRLNHEAKDRGDRT